MAGGKARWCGYATWKEEEFIMTLVNWSPLREFDDLFNRYSRVFGNLVPAGEEARAAVTQWRPTANVAETDAEYLVKAELPGVEKKDVEVKVEEGVLTIRGERRYDKEHDSETQHRVESFYGSFARSFTVPADVDVARIQAESKDGVLTIHLPKAEQKKPKAIDVQVR
jgi:HSP20 family protein